MGFVRPAIAAGCAVLVVSIAAVAAVDNEDEPQQVSSAAATTGATAPPTTAAPPGSPVAGLSPAELKAVVEAAGAPGTLSVERATVPEVAGDSQGRSAGRSVTLIRIPGSHPVRALGATVALDGTDVGPGFLVPDGMVAVLTDPALARPGAVVTYRYGDGAPTTAGTLPGGG